MVILGVGIHPDSAQATLFRTVINMPLFSPNPGNFILGPNADGCQLHGIVFTASGGGGGSVMLGTAGTTDIDDVAFIRCEFQVPLLLSNYGSLSLCEGLTIKNCVVHDDLHVNEASVSVYGSVLNDVLYSDGNCSFTNCVFLSPSSLGSTAANSYQGNIFLKNGSAGTWNITTPGTFTSNVFVYQSGTVTFTAPAFSTDETIATSPANVFLGAPDWDVFLYTEDYSVKPAYQAAGVNNTMPGIYGGPFPWKEGCIPFNPHWSLLNLTQGTTVNGILPGVQMKGSAQTN